MSKDPEHHLLLVDQDLDYLEWATKHLAADGLKILRCDSAEKAAQVIKKAPIDVVISDLKLEPFDGDELMRGRLVYPGRLNVDEAVFGLG